MDKLSLCPWPLAISLPTGGVLCVRAQTGNNKMDTDDGGGGGSTAVVDMNTKFYSADNIFIVDACIFPGQITANLSGMIVTVAEQAARKILPLKAPAV
jgi:cellobiose dehydrogenase (acceptor)